MAPVPSGRARAADCAERGRTGGTPLFASGEDEEGLADLGTHRENGGREHRSIVLPQRGQHHPTMARRSDGRGAAGGIRLA